LPLGTMPSATMAIETAIVPCPHMCLITQVRTAA
jgi:hypothetical protein